MQCIFNMVLALNFFWLQGTAALSMVDVRSIFGNAVFAPDQSAESIWGVFFPHWICAQIGAPQYVIVDQGGAFLSKYFTDKWLGLGIQIIPRGTEANWRWDRGERYHQKVRAVYENVFLKLRRNDTHLLIFRCLGILPELKPHWRQNGPLTVLYGQITRILISSLFATVGRQITEEE